MCGQKSILLFLQSTCFSCQILMKNFLYRFSKNTQIPNLIRIITVAAGLFLAYRRIDTHRQTTDRQTDRQTDRHDNLIVAFRGFANARQAECGKQVNNEHLRNAVSDCAVVLNKFPLAT